jgi:hypothetical protein
MAKSNPTPIRSYRDLDAWQLSMEIVVEILPHHEGVSGRRKVRPYGAAASGGGLDSVKHRRAA